MGYRNESVLNILLWCEEKLWLGRNNRTGESGEDGEVGGLVH
jgi:hypothetical protein